MNRRIRSELQQLRSDNLCRSLRTTAPAAAGRIRVGGRDFLNCCSNDYLGLSASEGAITAAREALGTAGVGATASRLICGHSGYHEQAEHALAAFKQREACLLFPSGYMANLAIFSTLAGKNDAIIIDRLAHASMVDAARLSQARLLVFDHNSPGHLSEILQRYRSRFEEVFVATEAVFSMDGDIVPLPELLQACADNGATLVVDEAHSTGVLGITGRGIEEYFGLKNQIPVLMGTASKALGAQGGFVCASRDTIDYLVTKARPFIYTTGLAPALCAAITANVSFIACNPQYIREYHDRLVLFHELTQKHRLPIACHGSGIFPLITGSTEKALALAEALQQEGILASAIREPTVPRGSARVRITVTYSHTAADITCLAETLHRLCIRLQLS